MNTEIPVDVQVFRAYPHVRELLEQRQFDVSKYPALTYEEVSESKQQAQLFVPPILTTEHKTKTVCFGEDSREQEEINAILEKQSYTFSREFQNRYPVFATLFLGFVNKQDSDTDYNDAFPNLLMQMYADFTSRRVEVHFHQCFNPENIWGANSRDKRFMNEMNAMFVSMEETAQERFANNYMSTLQNHLPKHVFMEHHESLIAELTSLYKKSYTLLFLFRTRSKASSTLDQKYEHYCADILRKHGVFVQLFNARHLMFNVTKHEIVPTHEALDVWKDYKEIESIKRVYNMTNLAKENPAIGLSDPVAKFIGLRRGQLCKITRINPSSGTYVSYRWCK